MNLKYLTVGVAVAASLLLVACNGDNGKNNNSAAGTSANNSPVIATVNGEAIHASTLDALLSDMIGDRKINPPPQAKRQLLNRLVQLKALAQKAQQEGLADNPNVQAEIRIQQQALLAKALIRQHMKQHPVSDKDVEAAFQKQVQSMDQKEYKARHILVNDKKTAENVIDKLNNGADFAALAKKVSTGPSAKKGGELGWFSPSDMVKPFANAVEQLKKGEYTKQPVKTQFGWHVILLQDVRPVPQPKLSDMQASIKQQLQSKEVRDFVQKVQNEAKVDINESQFQPPTPQTVAPAQATPTPSTTTQPPAAASGE